MVESFHSNFVANVNLQYPVPYCRVQAQLPRKSNVSKVMIFLRDGKYVLTPALCPHLAFDMSETNLNEIGELICPLHGFVVNLFVPGNAGEIRERGSKANKSGYFVNRTGDEFEITGFNQ